MKTPTRFRDNRETLRPHPIVTTNGIRRQWIVGAVLSGAFALMCPAQSVVDTAFDPETGTFGLTSLNDGISAIPEPSVYLLLAIAAFTFLVQKSRKRLRS